jgi:hypothetical protein
MLGLACSRTAIGENSKGIVLPNPRLLRCSSADCYQMWLEKTFEANGVFPKQFGIDMNGNCLYCMTALYDKSVAIKDIAAAIDERYGKWAIREFEKSPLKLWRVEPEKFAIQLSTANKQDEKRKIADAGTKQALYIAFGGRSACNVPLMLLCCPACPQ